MRVAILGSGAMGSIFGAALLRSGAEVVFFDKRKEVVEAIKRDGLRLSGVLGDFTPQTSGLPLSRPSAKAEGHPLPLGGEGDAARCFATDDPAAIGPVDVAVVLVDSNATAEAAKITEGCLGANGFALTLQNGIGNWEALAERLGVRRILAGSTYNSGANLGPGRAAHTNRGPTVLGELDGTVSVRATEIARRFTETGLPTEASDNMKGHVWSKFVHNCAINPVAAVTGLRVGEIARNEGAAALLDRLLDEVLAVVAAEGVTLPDADPREEMRDHCWGRYNRPSMLQHLLAGRTTEIDALNGALVKRAKALGLAVPVNETIVLMVKALEQAGRRESAALDEAALEAAAKNDLRGERWGRV